MSKQFPDEVIADIDRLAVQGVGKRTRTPRMANRMDEQNHPTPTPVWGLWIQSEKSYVTDTLFASNEAAEKFNANWPTLKATVVQLVPAGSEVAKILEFLRDRRELCDARANNLNGKSVLVSAGEVFVVHELDEIIEQLQTKGG